MVGMGNRRDVVEMMEIKETMGVTESVKIESLVFGESIESSKMKMKMKKMTAMTLKMTMKMTL